MNITDDASWYGISMQDLSEILNLLLNVVIFCFPVFCCEQRVNDFHLWH